MKQPDPLLRFLAYLAAAIFGACLLIILLEGSGMQPIVRKDIPAADFLGIILSALGVMVAILTFFLGVLAFFGWTAFRTIIEDKFEDLFRRRFDASNPEYGALVDQLVEDARARNAAAAIVNEQRADDPDIDENEEADGSGDEVQ
jgi:hypothetical protein